MERTSEGEALSTAGITQSRISKDGNTAETRLVLPRDSFPGATLRAYWKSPIHRAQTELLGKILRG